MREARSGSALAILASNAMNRASTASIGPCKNTLSASASVKPSDSACAANYSFHHLTFTAKSSAPYENQSLIRLCIASLRSQTFPEHEQQEGNDDADVNSIVSFAHSCLAPPRSN